MNIMHGKNRNVPKSISLEMFAQIAVLVDYYECHEVVEIYSDMWTANLRKEFPETYSRKLVFWICISWVFRQPAEFKKATNVALKHSEGMIETMELPIPERIIQDINKRRQESLEHIITTLHDLLYKLRKGPESCSFECDSILLGALTKELDARNLFSPRPVPPFSGLSFEATAKSISTIRSPGNNGYYQPCYCSLNDRVVLDIDSSKMGLALEDY